MPSCSPRLYTLVILVLNLVCAVPALAQDEIKLTASDGTPGDRFGNSVSVSGDIALVGAFFDDNQQGAVYAFRRDPQTGAWTQEQKLTAVGGSFNQRFGSTVSLSGDVAVIAAVADDGFTGSAYVFRYDGTAWTQEQKLTASDGAEDDRFGGEGKGVSISGDVALIGASDSDDDGSSSGSAYVFRYDGTEWVEEQKLTASDAAAGDFFGADVSVSGDVALVTAPGNADGGDFSGSAYVFRYDGAQWVEEQKLNASDAGPFEAFGESVALSGDVAVIGASGDDSGRGSAYVFRYDGTQWVQEQKLTASDRAPNDVFGFDVALSGDVAVIGALFDDANRGSAYVFRYDGSAWSEDQKLTASDRAPGDRFGGNVSVSGDIALAGATGDDDERGGAYAFGFAPPVASEPGAVPAPLALRLDGPNPFRSATALALSLERAQAVRVEAFDVLGRRVALLHDGMLPTGEHRIAVDAAGLAPGLYVVRAATETAVQTRRLVLAH